MSINPQVQLKTTAILNIPVQLYKYDFTFIVNGDEFNTSTIIADLLSPVISYIHQNDPTFSTFTISTDHRGDFSNDLKLATFRPFTIPEDEIQFFAEVIEKLGNSSIDISNLNHIELTNDNIIEQLDQHEKFGHFYSQQIDVEIEYASSHFFELFEEHKDEMKRLKFDTIERIVSNHHLLLKNEDQLLSFIDFLYREGSCEYSKLYGYVIFTNISTAAIGEFIDQIQKDDLTEEAWISIAHRLKQPISRSQMVEKNGRYKGKWFLPNGERNFNGIIRHLLNESNGNIIEKVDITASTNDGNAPINVTHFDKTDFFASENRPDSWIMFDFKDRRVIPTNYQIMSYNNSSSTDHPKTWVIEGKTDENGQFEKIGGESDVPYLNGPCIPHVFTINNINEKEFRYIRMYHTGLNCLNRNYLAIGSFEIYGSLIE